MTAPHKDDEALSAVLDGEDSEDAAATVAHLAVCPTCQARLAALESVARKVAAPVTGRPQPAVDASIAAAMAAWPPTASSEPGAGSEPPEPWPPTEGTEPATVAGRRVPRAAWARRAALAIGGVAAALVAVGLIVVVFRSKGGPAAKTTASAPVLRSPSPSSTALPVSPSVDLGSQSDPGTVARLLAPSLAPQPAAKASSPGPPPILAGPTVPGAASATQPHQVVAGSCIEQLRGRLGVPPDGIVALVASLEWRGAPAAAVIFASPGGRAGAVVSLPGCAVLAILPM